MRAFVQLYLASMKEFLRDRLALFWTVAFPVLFILLFGIIFSGGNNAHYSLGIAVEDSGPIGAQIDKAFAGISVFTVHDGSRDALLDQFKQGDLSAVLVVPANLSSQVSSGQKASLDLYYDPTKQTDAQIVLTIVQRVVGGFDQQITQRPELLAVNPITVTASELRSIDYLLPGILAMSLMQLGLFATAPVLVQLRERQVLRRIGATPLPRTTLLAAQLAFRLTTGLAQTAIIILVGIFTFNVHVIGNWAMLVGFVLLGSVMFVALGYLIAGLAKTQESVTGITQVLNFPMMFLSGIFFPLAIMPDWIKPVVTILPLTYLGDALRQIMVGAPADYGLGVDAAVIGGWLVVCGIGAVRLFRWE